MKKLLKKIKVRNLAICGVAFLIMACAVVNVIGLYPRILIGDFRWRSDREAQAFARNTIYGYGRSIYPEGHSGDPGAEAFAREVIYGLISSKSNCVAVLAQCSNIYDDYYALVRYDDDVKNNYHPEVNINNLCEDIQDYGKPNIKRVINSLYRAYVFPGKMYDDAIVIISPNAFRWAPLMLLRKHNEKWKFKDRFMYINAKQFFDEDEDYSIMPL